MMFDPGLSLPYVWQLQQMCQMRFIMNSHKSNITIILHLFLPTLHLNFVYPCIAWYFFAAINHDTQAMAYVVSRMARS